MPTEEEKMEYWANVLMGGWVLEQQKLGHESFDTATFAMIKQGVLMGLNSPLPSDATILQKHDDLLKP